MINPWKAFNIHDYIEIVLRRIWYFIIPFAIVVAVTAGYYFIAPPKYRATTLILVTPQKIPIDYVRPTVTSTIEDRLQSIGQEIMSRTRLEQMITEFKLYQKEKEKLTMEEIVEFMRKDIAVHISGRQGYFTISYIGKDPRIVTMVTNRLASLFIEENLKLRETQAQGTTEFLSIELAATKAKLDEQEKVITQFKTKFLYELPDWLQTNLRFLGGLHEQLKMIGDTLRSSQDRKLTIQKQLTEMKNMAAFLSQKEYARFENIEPPSIPGPSLSPPSPSLAPEPIVNLKAKDINRQQLEQFKNHLVELRTRYTEKHPDILSAKKRIAELEKRIEASQKEFEEIKEKEIKEKEIKEKEIKEKEIKEKEIPPPKIVTAPPEPLKEKGKKEEVLVDPIYKEIEGQLYVTELEIQRLKDEELTINGKIVEYQRRIENTPVREIVMGKLISDYEDLKKHYSLLLHKSQEAQQAENLEKRQKGEQFKVVDPARIPEKPFSPNILKVFAFGILLGVMSGFGAAFFKEQTDRSFRDAEDLETTMGFKVLANIPKIEKKAA